MSYQLVDSFSGVGRIKAGGQIVCDAKYEIRVYQDIVKTKGKQKSGPLSYDGIVEPTGDDASQKVFASTELQLEMEDGRALDFFYEDGWRIAVASPIHSN